jgi:hypothetical protein
MLVFKQMFTFFKVCCSVEALRQIFRSNFLCYSHLSDMYLSSKKIDSCSKYKNIFQYKLKHPFGAEAPVAEMRQA